MRTLGFVRALGRSVVAISLFLSALAAPCLSDVVFDLGTAKLRLSDQGQLVSLQDAQGNEYATAPAGPAFCLETRHGFLLPASLTRKDRRLIVQFPRGRAEFEVAEHPGFLVFDLVNLVGDDDVEQVQLINLSLKKPQQQAHHINACFYDSFVVSVMGAQPHVLGSPGRPGSVQGDRAGCSHTFTQATDDVKVGRFAADFTAASTLDKTGGYSVRGKRLPASLDLTGCKAVRAWVRGDGKGQQLKIQLFDGAKGYRDDYIAIDFKGWRLVECANPQLNTLNYGNVAAVNFYYNSMPAKETVNCRIDQVEAVLADGRTVVLEDFENPRSPLWGATAADLCARTFKERGLAPARFGVIACPREDFAKTIERFEAAAGMPSPKPGGVWSKTSPWTKRSYFFLTGFRESQFDEALAIARRGGFDMILLVQSSWCASTGHYEINTKNFPDGLEGLKRTVKRFKDAGFKFGLHFLGPSIYPPDKYLTPVPDPRLVKDKFTTLDADIDDKTDFIPTPDAPKDFPAEDGGYEGPGSVLQIDDELMWYAARAMEAPFGFRECKRGLLGTVAAPHKKGARVAHLLKSYGYFLFDMDTTLIDEAAANFAKVANACDIDMIYFDGSERLQGDHWYYNAKLHKTFYDHLKNKNMLLQASSHNHYSWHLMARTASADGHGDLKGYLDERSPSFLWMKTNLMPRDIGWYYGYDVEATPDEYEYILGASVGYDSSISYQVSPDAAARQPFTIEILDMIARYEKLRLSERVPEEMKARLRIEPELGGKKSDEDRLKLWEKRREYRLLGPEGKEVFQRVIYHPWREVGLRDGKNDEWSFAVREGPARVGVQIHVKPSPWLRPGPAYRSPDALLLESFDDLAPYTKDPKNNFSTLVIGPGKAGSTSKGVTQEFVSTEADAREGGRCAVYTATSALLAPGGWSSMGKRFDPPLDLSRHKGIGFWLRGDGKGGRFKLQLHDGTKACDYYITNDFIGWRYQQLARPEQDPIDYTKVRHLGLYYNVLPAQTTVSCGIDDVKALRSLDAQVVYDPCVKVGGKEIRWAGPMSAGQWLFAWPGEPERRYEVAKGLTAAGDPAPEIVLPAGEHKVTVECRGDFTVPLQVRITVQPPERHEIR